MKIIEKLLPFIQNGKMGFKNENEEVVIEPVYDDYGEYDVDFYHCCHYFDSRGEVLLLETDDDVYLMSCGFKGGLCPVSINGKWGFIDKTGKEIVPMIYDEAYPFENGLACVELNGKRGFIDNTGKEIIPLIYNSTYHFDQGLACVELNGKWGLIDPTGTYLIPPKYDGIDDLDVKRNMLVVKHGKYFGCVNLLDEKIFSFVYSGIRLLFDGMIALERDYDWKIIDVAGNLIYDYADNCDYCHFFPIGLKGKYGFIDAIEEKVIALKYDEVADWHYDYADDLLAAVMLNDKWGFINKTGEVVIPLIYDEVERFKEGRVRVCIDDRWIVIDKEGKEV